MNMQILKKSRPNGWFIQLVKYSDEENVYYEVQERGDMNYEYDTEEEALKYYDERVKELMDVPNWELQSKYDEEHGTDNGYSYWDYQREY